MDVIDTMTGQFAGAVTGVSDSHGIAIDARDGRGFISSGGSNIVIVFDLATLRTVQTIPVAAGPDAIVYESHSQRIVVFSGEARIMTAIDAKNGTIAFAYPIPGRPEFAVADFRNGLVYDNYVDRSAIAELDPRLHSTGDVYPVAPGEHPTGLAIDNTDGRVFSGCSNQTLIAMDIETGTVLSSLPIGAGVDAVGYDPGLTRVYASSGGSGTVTVIDRLPGTQDQYQVAATIPTLPGARTMTVDTKTHHFFVAGPSGGALVVQEYAPAGQP